MFHDAFAFVGQFLRLACQKDSGQAQILSPVKDIMGNGFPVQQGGIGYEQHDAGFQRTVSAVFLFAVAQDLRQGIEHFSAFRVVCRHITDFFVSGPDMGQPEGKIPGVPINIVVFVAYNRDFHVGIAVGGGDLGNHGLRDSDCGSAVLSARDAYHTVFQQVHRHGNAFQHPEIFL